jgi:hypothetical protein
VLEFKTFSYIARLDFIKKVQNSSILHDINQETLCHLVSRVAFIALQNEPPQHLAANYNVITSTLSSNHALITLRTTQQHLAQPTPAQVLESA